ncbi:MAG: aldo/keto reductase [Myxococcales bacterium]|nr:aldo/keto reductase [Myxococcales bacterium]USN50618.1 MAG: aldo/keto reductase [Myxococcales bacterium]
MKIFFILIFFLTIQKTAIGMEDFAKKTIPSHTVLGFGTQSINSENSFLVKEALDNGYRLFDCAQKYDNIDIIAPIIVENNRKESFIIYKISPPTTIKEYRNTINDITKVINTLKYIDCLMLHSTHDFHNNIDSDVAKYMINNILKFMSNDVVHSFGLSNIGMMYQKIITDFEKQNLKVSLIENHCNHNTISFEPTKGLLNFCKENNIAFIAYGTLGGITYQGYCQALCNVFSPAICVNKITHPAIIKLSKKHHIDPMMVVLAFLSKKFGMHQIPTTTKSERIINNFESFNKAMKILIDEDYHKINTELGLITEDITEKIPQLFLKGIKYASRMQLYNHLVNTKHPLIKTIEKAQFMYGEEQSEIDRFVNKMMYMAEQALQYNVDDSFKALLGRINNLLNTDDDNYRSLIAPHLKSVLNTEVNQAGGALVMQFIQDLSTIELLEFHKNFLLKENFTIIDDSEAEPNWPDRSVIIASQKLNKIVRFTISETTTVGELTEKLQSYGFSEALLSYGDSINLSLMEKDSVITKHEFFSMCNNSFSIDEDDASFENFIVRFSPFSDKNKNFYNMSSQNPN